MYVCAALDLIEFGVGVSIVRDPYKYVCVALDSTRAANLNTHNNKQALPWAKGSNNTYFCDINLDLHTHSMADCSGVHTPIL